MTDRDEVTNNGSVIRRVLAAGLSVSVLFAALAGPFVHVHPDDHDTDHHPGHAVHAHLSGHDSPVHSDDGPQIGRDDRDRAVFLQVFVAVAPSTFGLSATAVMPFVLPVPQEMPARLTMHVAHGHDPPTLISLPSRAPPALLA